MISKMTFVCSGHDSGLIRWALKYLCEAVNWEGVQTEIVDLAKTTDTSWIQDTEAVLVYRSFDLKALHLMQRLKQSGKFVMFFLDDYLFQPGCKYTNGWMMPMEPLREADCLVSSSARLLSYMPKKPKILRRSVMDEESMQILSQSYRRDTSKFDIGWLGSLGRLGMMDKFVYDMLKALDAGILDGTKCTLHHFGARGYPQFPKVAIKEHLYVAPGEWKSLYSKWVGFDLGAVINPLNENDEFCHCKSELKYVESGAMGVPLVTSRVAPYTEFVIEGENGFFASKPKEYAEKLLLLMKDEALSRRVSENCKAYVVKNYNVQDNAKQFIADVNRAMTEAQATIEIESRESRLKRHFGWDGIPRKPF